MMFRHPRHRPAVAWTAGSACGTDLLLTLFTEAGLNLPVPSRLTYSRDDPHAVRLDCHVDLPDPAAWFFARDLLLAGLHEQTGHGDVRIRPGLGSSRGHLFITLGQPDDSAVLRAAAWEVEEFAIRSLRVVPAGAEHLHVDLDAMVDRLRPQPD